MKKRTGQMYSTCLKCKRSTIPLKNMKERCSECNTMYLIYGDKIEA